MGARPVILVSGSTQARGAEFGDASLSLSLAYPLAVEAGGGIPWILPCLPRREHVAESVRRADGVLLTGGEDVQPLIYGPALPPSVARTVRTEAPERDLFELLLIDEVFRQRKPLLAICRGHQILNVALGGTLIADIPQQVPGALKHGQTKRKDQVVHEVRCAVGSLLAEVVGRERFGVNSSHHQAVANIAKPLQPTAVSIDGIVEGLELGPEARHLLPYLLAVQFHPERLFQRHAEHLRLFESFMRACSRNREREV